MRTNIAQIYLELLWVGLGLWFRVRVSTRIHISEEQFVSSTSGSTLYFIAF